MLKIKVLAIGKDKDLWITDGIKHYLKLLSRYSQVDLQTLPDVKNAASLSPVELKRAEAELLIKKLPKTGRVIGLTERGRSMDSVRFSQFLGKLELSSGGSVTFLIGGIYGLDERVLALSQFQLSLSSLTFSHQLVRLILFEQLYRAFNLLRGGDYHK